MRIFLFLLILYSTSSFAAIKALIFDFGGVVAVTDRSPVMQLILKTFPDADPHDFDGDKLYIALNEGEGFWEDYAYYHRKAHPLGHLPVGFMEQINSALTQIVRLNPEVQALVQELKEEGYIVGLLSNTSAARATFLRRGGYYAPFSPAIISSDFKVQKPDAEIYRILLRTLNLPAREVVFIDNKTRNVETARKLGMEGIVFTSGSQLRADLAKILSRAEKAPAQ